MKRWSWSISPRPIRSILKTPCSVSAIRSLCCGEKAFTANAKQAKELLDYARKEKVFITEAIWVRYLPMLQTIRQELADGVIGSPTMLTANLGISDQRGSQAAAAGPGRRSASGCGRLSHQLCRMIFGDRIAKISSACHLYGQRGGRAGQHHLPL